MIKIQILSGEKVKIGYPYKESMTLIGVLEGLVLVSIILHTPATKHSVDKVKEIFHLVGSYLMQKNVKIGI